MGQVGTWLAAMRSAWLVVTAARVGTAPAAARSAATISSAGSAAPHSQLLAQQGLLVGGAVEELGRVGGHELDGHGRGPPHSLRQQRTRRGRARACAWARAARGGGCAAFVRALNCCPAGPPNTCSAAHLEHLPVPARADEFEVVQVVEQLVRLGEREVQPGLLPRGDALHAAAAARRAGRLGRQGRGRGRGLMQLHRAGALLGGPAGKAGPPAAVLGARAGPGLRLLLLRGMLRASSSSSTRGRLGARAPPHAAGAPTCACVGVVG